jgi:hypothetical protein
MGLALFNLFLASCSEDDMLPRPLRSPHNLWGRGLTVCIPLCLGTPLACERDFMRQGKRGGEGSNGRGKGGWDGKTVVDVITQLGLKRGVVRRAKELWEHG